MEDKPDWIFLDDAPADLRSHTLMQSRPRNRDELFASLKSPDMDFLRRTGIVDADGNFVHRKVDPNTIRDPDHITEEQAALAISGHGKTFAQELLSVVPASERPALAAPPRQLCASGRQRSRTFDPRHPKYIEERHGKYLEAGSRRFSEVAMRDRRSSQHASIMKNELTLLHLGEGRQPSWSIINGKLKHAPQDEGPLASAIFPLLWQAHEEALLAAEVHNLTSDGTVPLLSNKGRLLAEFFSAATLLKLSNGSVMNYSPLWKALGRIIEAARKAPR
jgi:hypothetical protein